MSCGAKRKQEAALEAAVDGIVKRSAFSGRSLTHRTEMARQIEPYVLLGFEDERVTDKNRQLVDYTTNKIGGTPVSGERETFRDHALICIR
jgi:hypothetical protein